MNNKKNYINIRDNLHARQQHIQANMLSTKQKKTKKKHATCLTRRPLRRVDLTLGMWPSSVVLCWALLRLDDVMLPSSSCLGPPSPAASVCSGSAAVSLVAVPRRLPADAVSYNPGTHKPCMCHERGNEIKHEFLHNMRFRLQF